MIIEIRYVSVIVNIDISRKRHNTQVQIPLIQWIILCKFIGQTKPTNENIEFGMYSGSKSYWPTSTSSV